jgi:hypothetical protein
MAPGVYKCSKSPIPLHKVWVLSAVNPSVTVADFESGAMGLSCFKKGQFEIIVSY